MRKMPINMNFSPCHLNTCNNINYLQRSQTLQPIRSNGFGLQDFSDPKQYMLYKYFASQINSAMLDVGSPERANYANVPHNKLEQLYPSLAGVVEQKQHDRDEHEHDHNHHHHHNRQPSSILGPLPPPSHSYHTMRQADDLNRYYNIGHPLHSMRDEMAATTATTNAPINVQNQHHHHSHHHNPHPQHHRHHPSHPSIQPLNNIDIMQVCNELGTLDSPPAMPNPRRYTITKASDQSLYKVPFPQGRFMGAQFFDPITGLVLSRGTPINVLGPARDDRSKLTICHQADHIDLTHQLTEPPQPLKHEQLLQ